MTSRQTTAEKPKYFDLDIHGIGYLNRVVDAGGKALLFAAGL